MLDALVALAHGSTALADHLRASIRQHGRPLLTAVTFRRVTEAARLAALPPHADHAISAWLRPRVAQNRLLAGCSRTLIHFVTEDERFGMSTATHQTLATKTFRFSRRRASGANLPLKIDE
jgi:hypothetical protein